MTALLRPARLRIALVGIVALGAAAPFVVSSAHSDQADLLRLDPVHRTLQIGAAIERSDCATTKLAGKPGVTTTSWTAPQGRTFSLAARLDGPAGSDWDLAVFDHATGKRLGGSAGFGSNELVQAFTLAGRQLDLQACRVSGPATSVPLTIYAVGLPTTAGKAPRLKEQMIHIDLPDAQANGVLDRMGIDRVEDGTSKGVDATIHTQDELDLLKRAGFTYRVTIPDLAAFDRQQATRNAAYTRAAGAAGSPLPSGRTTYRHLEDIQADLKKLVQDYPAIVKPVTLPKKTFLGRDTMGVEISSDVNRPDDQKPTSFIMGEHHAREWPSEELTTEFAMLLAQQFGTDDEITKLLQHVRVVVVPVINSDGFNVSREDPDFADNSGDPGGAPSLAESVAAGGSLAYRRKNCDGVGNNPAVPCDLQVGVDPNRNYGQGWGGPGASSSPNSQSYRGTGPWSEPETQAVHEYSQGRDVTSLLTMHNFASLVLRPPGLHTDGQAPDEERLKELGDAMGADTGYTSQYSYQLYDTSGTTEDWNYGAAGTFGYTMELGPESGDGGNFHISYDRAVVEQWMGAGTHAGRGVRRALLRVAEAAASRQDFSTVFGRAPAGRILRLHKTFQTSTSPVCEIASPTDVSPPGIDDSCVNPGDPIVVDDKLDYTTKVPANGVYSWIVTPSTRPFVYKKGGRESWTLTCEDDAGKVYSSQDVTIWRNEAQSFDLPCGGTLPDTAPLTLAEADKLALADKLAPRSSITRKSLKASRTRISLAGTATDTAPAGLRARVAKVLVTIGRRTGKRCRFLTPQGTLGPKVSCLRTKYVVARVNKPARSVHWSYSLGAKLPAGRYLTWSRSVDAAGNVELKAKSRNLKRFTIR